MDKRAQKIIDKCHILISRGFDLEYCLKRFSGYGAEIKEYFSIAEELGILRKTSPSKEFRENSLDSIIKRAESQEEQAASQYLPAVSRRKLVLRPAMIFLAFIVISVFSFSGTLFASQNSLPGETLYPLKRSFEEFRLNIYPDDFKGGLHLKFLNNRIEEAEMLLDMENGTDPAFVEELISEMERQYQSCRKYNCIEPGNEDDILASIDSVKNRYSNRFGKETGGKGDTGQDGVDQHGKENNNQNGNGMSQGGNSRGSGKSSRK